MCVVSCRSEPSSAKPNQQDSSLASSSSTSWASPGVSRLPSSRCQQDLASVAARAHRSRSATSCSALEMTGELDEPNGAGQTPIQGAGALQSRPCVHSGQTGELEQSESKRQSSSEQPAMSSFVPTTTNRQRRPNSKEQRVGWAQDVQVSEGSCSVCFYLASIRALSSDKTNKASRSGRPLTGKRSASCQERADRDLDKPHQDSEPTRRAGTSRVHKTEVEYTIQDATLVKRATDQPQSAGQRFGELCKHRSRVALHALRGLSLDCDRSRNKPAGLFFRRLKTSQRSSSSKSLLGKLIVISFNKVSYAIQGKLRSH